MINRYKFPSFITPGTFILSMLLLSCTTLQCFGESESAQSVFMIFTFSLLSWSGVKFFEFLEK